MIHSVKNKFVFLILLLGSLPVEGQVYTTSDAKVHSVSTSGVNYDAWDNSTLRGNEYGPLNSFYSTSSNETAGPDYSVSVPSINVRTSFSTSATDITGGVTLADDLGLDVENKKDGPHKAGFEPPHIAPIGDIPWGVTALAALAVLLIKKREEEMESE